MGISQGFHQDAFSHPMAAVEVRVMAWLAWAVVADLLGIVWGGSGSVWRNVWGCFGGMVWAHSGAIWRPFGAQIHRIRDAQKYGNPPPEDLSEGMVYRMDAS